MKESVWTAIPALKRIGLRPRLTGNTCTQIKKKAQGKIATPKAGERNNRRHVEQYEEDRQIHLSRLSRAHFPFRQQNPEPCLVPARGSNHCVHLFSSHTQTLHYTQHICIYIIQMLLLFLCVLIKITVSEVRKIAFF